MNHNPFRYLQPVTSQAFVGRWPLVNDLVQNLLMETGDSHAIIGGPRSGKTSILRVVEEQLRQPTQYETGDYLPVPVYIDFKAALFDSAEAVFAFLLQQVYHQINTAIYSLGIEMQPPRARASHHWFTELINAPKLAQQDFEVCMLYLLDQLEGNVKSVRLILLLDESGKSLDQPWTNALYMQARNLLSVVEFNQRVRLVLASSYRFLEQTVLNDLPLCGMLKLHCLQAFDQIALDQLLAFVPGLPVTTQMAIRCQSGGHPFLTQYLLYHVWERTKGMNFEYVDVTQIDNLVAGFLHQYAFELESWFHLLSASDIVVYRTLSLAADWMTEEQILATVVEPVQRIKRILFTLCTQELVIHNENWTHFRYTGKIFRQMLSPADTCRPSGCAIMPNDSSITPPVYNVVNINTGGGAYIAGSVGTDGGNFVGHNAVMSL